MQKEIVMLTAMNDLKTEVKVSEKALSAQQAREGELERMLAKEQVRNNSHAPGMGQALKCVCVLKSALSTFSKVL